MDDKTWASIEVLNEVFEERKRQDQVWGEQNHPSGTRGAVEDILGPHVGWFGGDHARDKCKMAFREDRGTYAHIFLEEVAEAMDERDETRLREELVQAAAVAVAWIEAIDRRRAKAAA